VQSVRRAPGLEAPHLNEYLRLWRRTDAAGAGQIVLSDQIALPFRAGVEIGSRSRRKAL
jgi:hypothetical protein